MSFLQKPAIRAFVDLAHKRTLPSKHTIIHAGDAPTSVYLILQGSVSILLEDDNGREIVLAYLNEGEFFGEMCLFPELGSRSAIVRTRLHTLIAEVAYPKFDAFVMKNPRIMYELAGQLATRLRDTSRRLGDLTFLDVAGRLARVLIELSGLPDAQPHADGALIKCSRQELARLIGCSREMAGRVLRRLEEDGMVRASGRSILIIGATAPEPPPKLASRRKQPV